jgi:hypothetical protein
MPCSPRILALAAAACLHACVTPLLPEQQLGLDARRAPDVALGEPIRLLERPPERLAGIISLDGRVHVFAIDAARTLRHVEIAANAVVAREQVAMLEGDPHGLSLHAIEWPPGTLRVVAGSSQFVRAPSDPGWQEAKGNRCARFLPVAGRLFCAFVLSGEELASPKRTDVYGGLIILLPFAIPVERQSRKLVIAEAAGERWVVRAALDVDDPLDAFPIEIGSDAQGNVHVLYNVGRGGMLILFFPAGGGGVAESPERRLRYARVPADALLAAGQAAPGGQGAPLVTIKGLDVRDSPWSLPSTRRFWWGDLAVNPVTGAIEGLYGSTEVRLDGKFYTQGMLLAVEMRDGVWQERPSIALVDHWPEDGASYKGAPSKNVSVTFDQSGALHALVAHDAEYSMWHPTPAFAYLLKRGGEWSRPLTFRIGLPHAWPYPRLLLADEARLFVAWAERDAGLLGRWILPHPPIARE